MLAGTGSDVGKSIIATALCRIFLQDGYHPAPFKAQNMALNSYATPDGLEIGRAQAVQAEAAGVDCHTDMNPLLLKPQSDHSSQVVLHGKPIGSRDAYDFWQRTNPKQPKGIDFRREVCQAYDRLAEQFNPIVMEGAGSITELNLRATDIVNMPMAAHARASVVLVGDIDRGGIFASVYGSIALQSEEDRKRIKGIIVNKFRGDMKLFDKGRKMLEDLCQVPVLGVVPFMGDLHIDEEDSVALHHKAMDSRRSEGKVSVAVVMLRHLSNFTDFNALELDARVHLYYTANADDLDKADIVVLPGTKSTLSDLYELRRSQMAQAIVAAHRRGATVLGICGGYQMMGTMVEDPHHVEGEVERLPGLGLLPVQTTLAGEKVTRQSAFTLTMAPEAGTLQGYEIHMGQTVAQDEERPLAILADGRRDGYHLGPRCMGTYLHGILDNKPFVDYLLQPYLPTTRNKQATNPSNDYATFREREYDRLAAHVRKHIDMERLYAILKEED